jgi:P27 family predicted phage terminase small subunit
VPKHLTAPERQRFRQLCAGLEKRRALTREDGEILALYCVTWSRWRRSLDDIAARGEVIEIQARGKNDEIITRERPNPYLKIAETCEKAMANYLAALGMTPAAREKVKPVKKNEEKEPFPVGSVGWLLQQAKEEAANGDDGNPIIS